MMNCTGKNCIMQYNKVDPATCKCISYCPQATPPKTNADRIRAMSNRELAKALHDAGCNWYSEDYGLEWLEQEVNI